MFSDYHVHSSFSFDSEESPRAIVEKAIALWHETDLFLLTIRTLIGQLKGNRLILIFPNILKL